ncbi:8-oxo-dGTP diphosphatase [Leucobacter sp. M11]|uniref:8-oxo-dGTP diphosphatase n=1 Tax=Leucobacter sp. M11 TaxID=2993565 RepID=UPI002D7F271E|nr:NUDIX domain-containing protein [Leucobacter sp. M11]MEB4615709.1 NUDIX domain-containing protein [Leucobacter sp. M11]
MSTTQVTVCYLLAPDPAGGELVLLGEKRTGLGLGKVVAPGGKLEAGESPAEACAREVLEESGLTVRPEDLIPAGLLRYRFPYRPSWDQDSHVFLARAFSGTAADSDELRLGWVPSTQIPLERMWHDARLWLPGVLGGGGVALDIEFGPDNDTVATVTPTPEGARP